MSYYKPVGRYGGLFLFAAAAWGQQYVISTVAGGASLQTPAAALTLAVASPVSVATDSAGNTYYCDAASVYKLDRNGVANRIAGNSRPGYSGDGGAATSAQLNGPAGIAFDAAGNMFIADADNERIRKVSTAGIITTVAGSSSIRLYSSDGGPAVSAQLCTPENVVVDRSGNLFFADTCTHRIRMVSRSGIITTVAGSGVQGYSGDGGPAVTAQLNFPYGIALDGSGNLFIADTRNNSVRMVSANGNITTVAGTGTAGYSGDGGLAINAQLSFPAGIAVDGYGSIFVADTLNQRVRMISANGIITT